MSGFWKSVLSAVTGGAIGAVGGISIGAVVAQPKQMALAALLGAVTALIHLFVPSPAQPQATK